MTHRTGDLLYHRRVQCRGHSDMNGEPFEISKKSLKIHTSIIILKKAYFYTINGARSIDRRSGTPRIHGRRYRISVAAQPVTPPINRSPQYYAMKSVFKIPISRPHFQQNHIFFDND